MLGLKFNKLIALLVDGTDMDLGIAVDSNNLSLQCDVTAKNTDNDLGLPPGVYMFKKEGTILFHSSLNEPHLKQ